MIPESTALGVYCRIEAAPNTCENAFVDTRFWNSCAGSSEHAHFGVHRRIYHCMHFLLRHHTIPLHVKLAPHLPDKQVRTLTHYLRDRILQPCTQNFTLILLALHTYYIHAEHARAQPPTRVDPVPISLFIYQVPRPYCTSVNQKLSPHSTRHPHNIHPQHARRNFQRALIQYRYWRVPSKYPDHILHPHTKNVTLLKVPHVITSIDSTRVRNLQRALILYSSLRVLSEFPRTGLHPVRRTASYSIVTNYASVERRNKFQQSSQTTTRVDTADVTDLTAQLESISSHHARALTIYLYPLSVPTGTNLVEKEAPPVTSTCDNSGMGRTKREQRRRKVSLRSNHEDYVFCSEEDDYLDHVHEEDGKDTAARHSLITAHLRDTASRRKRRKSIPIQHTTAVRQDPGGNERAHVRDEHDKSTLRTAHDGSTEGDKDVTGKKRKFPTNRYQKMKSKVNLSTMRTPRRRVMKSHVCPTTLSPQKIWWRRMTIHLMRTRLTINPCQR